ncbi:hypothetical protein [Silvimonas iriomotensis]|uniref:Solute:sodium symporter small subunit n=1 Tax=Silvimonas iriomotensis TaxID=449662 RepID=A0ABQ2PER5_9NEIS|nr:hypothetical protein [Silvimonas iriomotensis]GGP23752.1 hypothetical protein GCM10010970_37520 [Silvimonas iriomotensis]
MSQDGNQDELDRYQRIIDGGWWWCVLWRGVVCLGVPGSVLLYLVRALNGISADPVSGLLHTFPLGLTAGFIYGLALWGFAQLQILKAKREKD